MSKVVCVLVCALGISALACGSSKKETSKETTEVESESSAASEGSKKDAPKKEDAVTKPAPVAGDMKLPWGDDVAKAKSFDGCDFTPKPTADHLGVTAEQLVACIEGTLSQTPLAAKLKLKFAEKKSSKEGVVSYEIEKYVSLVIVQKDGHVASLDAFFLPTHRKELGMMPELAAQQILLAALVPSAERDPRRGAMLFGSIDERARAANSHMMKSQWEGVAIESSFLPISVRYRVAPAPR